MIFDYLQPINLCDALSGTVDDGLIDALAKHEHQEFHVFGEVIGREVKCIGFADEVRGRPGQGEYTVLLMIISNILFKRGFKDSIKAIDSAIMAEFDRLYLSEANQERLIAKYDEHYDNPYSM